MPLCISLYAAVAALFVDGTPKGAPGRITAVLGAAGALVLALVAQVTAHWFAAGFLESSKVLVGAVSAVPPVVVAHIAHMVVRAAHASVTPTEELAVEPVPTPPVEPQDDQEEPEVGGGGDQEEPESEGDQEPKRTASPSSRRRSVEEITEAVYALETLGLTINGENLGERFGVSARQGRRYLKELATT
ncbi:hypothetical protein [Streptomyces sp. NPDC056524]|uniref:hypothetical protein n=1 Tax=Streptomyces sp. NPDC056524 TaxID=3345851 RepID=UPI0036BE5431